jgi:NAD(P)-dependent dehydrogenase (short-subunit alcohol dehydrogenase family)
VDGRVALVTGGASGIGRATCRRLAAEGAKIVVADINEAGGRHTVEEIGGRARFVRLDVAAEPSWEHAVAEVLGAFGRLDILVNCAGIGFTGSVEDTTLADWNRIVAVNLTGTFLGCKHAVRAMKPLKRGSIINISSVAGIVGGEDLTAYSATKGGVTVMTKAIALNCAAKGIRCNAILPTYVDSEMLDPVAAALGSREALLTSMAELVPLGRVALPDDIANAVLFLASDESAMITGSAMLVDGGTTAGLPSRHSSH